MLDAIGCPLPSIDPVCAIGGIGSSVVSTLLSSIAGWFQSAGSWFIDRVAAALTSTTEPPVTSAWFAARERVVLYASGPVALLALIAAALHALVHGALGELGRTVLLRLPIAFVLGAASAGIVGISLSATDQLCAMLGAGSNGPVASMLAGIGVATAAAGPVPGAVALLVALLVIAGAVALWLELVVRAAAITVVTALLPLVLAASLWPPAVSWARRTAETLGALIVSKAVIVLVLSIALAAITHAGSDASTAVTGAALLLLATFMPYAVLRLVPAIEAAAVTHLESVRHRATATARDVGRHGVSLAVAGLDAGLQPSVDPIGSNPIPMMPGIEGDITKGTALDPTATFVKGPPPIKAVPASAGTHVWERDSIGPRLVWKPPGYVPDD